MKQYLKQTFLFITLLGTGISFGQIQNGMIAHFPFNNNLNDISVSSIALSNNGTSFGNDRNGTANYAVEFDGTSSMTFNDDDIRVPFPISISFWVKLNSFTVGATPIFNSEDIYNTYTGYWINIGENGNVTMSMGDGTGGGTPQYRRTYTSTQAVTLGNWHHVICIYRSYNDMSIYIDCNLDTGSYSGSGQTTMAYDNNAAGSIGFSLGNSTYPNLYSDMSLDQLAIWSRELDSNEIVFLCDINNPLSIETFGEPEKKLIKIVDVMGRETQYAPNTVLIYVYSNGSIERVYHAE